MFENKQGEIMDKEMKKAMQDYIDKFDEAFPYYMYESRNPKKIIAKIKECIDNKEPLKPKGGGIY